MIIACHQLALQKLIPFQGLGASDETALKAPVQISLLPDTTTFRANRLLIHFRNTKVIKLIQFEYENLTILKAWLGFAHVDFSNHG